MPLQRGNFIGMAIAGAMIVLGFLLMLGGSSTAEALCSWLWPLSLTPKSFSGTVRNNYGYNRRPYNGHSTGPCGISAYQFVGAS